MRTIRWTAQFHLVAENSKRMRASKNAPLDRHTHKNKRSQFISVWWQFIACLVIVMLTWARWMQTHYCAIYLLHITRQKFRKKTKEKKNRNTEKKNGIALTWIMLHLWVESAAVFMCCPSEIVCNMNMETKNKRIHVVGDFRDFSFIFSFSSSVDACIGGSRQKDERSVWNACFLIASHETSGWLNITIHHQSHYDYSNAVSAAAVHTAHFMHPRCKQFPFQFHGTSFLMRSLIGLWALYVPLFSNLFRV